MQFLITWVLALSLPPTLWALAQTADPVIGSDCASPVRVATWNIENFSLGRWEDPATQTALVETWATLDADVVALQEIASEDALNNLLDAVYEATGRDYYFYLSETGNDSQMVGFAWDENTVDVIDEAIELEDVLLGGNRLRPAVVMAFEAGAYDFTAVVVHLKAQMDPPDIQIREAQTTVMADWYEALPVSADRDVIFLGDFNDFYDSESLAPLTSVAGFTAEALPADAYTYIGGDFQSLIDHIAVTPGTGSADGLCGVAVFEADSIGLTEGAFENIVSDHLPLLAEFAVGAAAG